MKNRGEKRHAAVVQRVTWSHRCGNSPATPRWEGDGTVDVKPISQAAASFLSQMRSEVAQVVEQSRKSTAASSKIQKSRAK